MNKKTKSLDNCICCETTIGKTKKAVKKIGGINLCGSHAKFYKNDFK